MEEVLYLVIGAFGAAVLFPRLRPALLAAATTVYQIADVVLEKAGEQWKKLDGLLAAARSRARCWHP